MSPMTSNTREFPVEISGPDAEKFANRVFARNVSRVKIGRYSYNFVLYHHGGMITGGVMLGLAEDKFWMAQTDGKLTRWHVAQAHEFDVTISDPNVWVTQVQGPRSMDVLRDAINGDFPDPCGYFDIATVTIAEEEVIVTRAGFSNELGWEFYMRPENNAEKIDNGNIVGQVCSSTWSPSLECGIALVRMDDPEMGPGTAVDVTGAGDITYSAQLCALPMYDAESAIAHGRIINVSEGLTSWKG